MFQEKKPARRFSEFMKYRTRSEQVETDMLALNVSGARSSNTRPSFYGPLSIKPPDKRFCSIMGGLGMNDFKRGDEHARA
jgi:hypothetical protein